MVKKKRRGIVAYYAIQKALNIHSGTSPTLQRKRLPLRTEGDDSVRPKKVR